MHRKIHRILHKYRYKYRQAPLWWRTRLQRPCTVFKKKKRVLIFVIDLPFVVNNLLGSHLYIIRYKSSISQV